MLKRIIKLPNSQSYFLFGARGTGKTTLLQKLYVKQSPKMAKLVDASLLNIDLLRAQTYTDYSLDPSLLSKQILGRKGLTRVIIDEIQRIPPLLNEVHALIEEHPRLQFILTGSSARKLKRGGANLLAGRAQVHHLHPFTARELGAESELKQDFELDNILRWGLLPKTCNLTEDDDKAEFLRAYALTYLREEILQEQLVRKLEPFQRFLPIAAQMSGKILNYSSIARDVGAASLTVENYFSILSDTLIGFFLPSFHPSIRKQERCAPKYFFFDTGVMRALSGHLEINIKPQTSYYGELFEHLVIQEVVKLSSYYRRDDRFAYYRTDSGLEIDLIITRPNEPEIFIEIKSANRINESHVKHLNMVAKDFPKARFYCFSLEKEPKQIDRVTCINWQDGIRDIGL